MGQGNDKQQPPNQDVKNKQPIQEKDSTEPNSVGSDNTQKPDSVKQSPLPQDQSSTDQNSNSASQENSDSSNDNSNPQNTKEESTQQFNNNNNEDQALSVPEPNDRPISDTLAAPEEKHGSFGAQVHSDIDFDLKNVFQKQGTSPSLSSKTHNNEINLDTNSNNNNQFQIMTSTLNQNDYELNFYRNGEEIRRSYIGKLIAKKIWTPSQKEKTHNSLIIFDWDDTLLPTSFLTPKGYYDENYELNEKDKEKLVKLEFSVLRLLNLSIGKGEVYIITNAGNGWVEYSAEKYYPSITKLLDKIKIISARGEYENQFPNDSRMWKMQAFLKIKANFDASLVTNIICLGDSFIEMEAGKSLASQFNQAFIKTVKFRESPKPEELNKQLTLVADQFNGIYSAVKNLTIRVEKKKK